MTALGKPGGRYEIQRVLPRHEKIIELALAGHKHTTIGTTLGITPRAISMILQSPLVQSEIKRRRESSDETELLRLDHDAVRGKALSILEQESGTAAETVVQLMGCEDPSIQLRSAVTILDRVFPKGDGKGNNGPMINVELTGEHAQLLVLALKESDNGQDNEQSADCPAADTTQDEQGDVHEASETPPNAK